MGDTLVINMPTPMSLTVYRGEVGPVGPTGPTGATGPQGPAGATTITGTALSVAADGALTIAGDTNLYRSAANSLKTDDNFIVGGGTLTLGGTAPVISATEISIANRTGVAMNFRVTGEANHQFYMRADGTLNWGPGGATAADVNLYRSAANTLKTDDALIVAGALTAQSGMALTGTLTIGGDTTLRRFAADFLMTDDHFIVAQSLYLTSVNPAIIIENIGVAERTNVLLYTKVTGEAQRQFQIRNDGRLTWGAGGATAPDTILYRSAADTLKTDDSLIIGANVGFYNNAATAKQTVTGSRGGNAALASLLTALAAVGLITNSSSA